MKLQSRSLQVEVIWSPEQKRVVVSGANHSEGIASAAQRKVAAGGCPNAWEETWWLGVL